MKSKRLHIIFIAGLFAAFLWLSVKLGSTYQMTVNVPVIVTNVPSGLALSTPVPKILQLRFRGEGWQLVPILLGPDPQYSIDLKDYGRGVRSITIDNLSSQFSPGGEVLLVGMNPDTVYIQLEQFAERMVRVHPSLDISFRDGYGQVGRTLIVPESVMVGGAMSVVERLDRWYTEHRSFTSIQSSVDAILTLADTGAFRMSFTPRSVRVQMNVQSLAEKTMSGLPVEIHDVPPGWEVIVIPPKIDLVVRSGVERLTTLSSSNFRLSAIYSEILADSTGTFIPDLDSPDDVQVISRRPGRLQYIVRKQL